MKRGQQFTMTTIGVLALVVIVVAVIVVIFVQQTTKTGQRFTELTEESKIDVTKCKNFFLGRKCYDSCPDNFQEVSGGWADCTNQVCCEPS
jgi:hypothetical protein